MNHLLPPETQERRRLHDEIHARPVGRVSHPAAVLCIALLNDNVSRSVELSHLRGLVGDEPLAQAVSGNFLRLPLQAGEIKWERHTEFTRYTIILPLPQDVFAQNQLDHAASVERIETVFEPFASWCQRIPGEVIAALQVTVLADSCLDIDRCASLASHWFAGSTVLASWVGNGKHSLVFTDFRVPQDGVERVLVLTKPDTPASRVGRTVQRLLEIEIYRLMALRALPQAKALSSRLTQAEDELASMSRAVESASGDDQALLAQLAGLASSIERAHADHNYRFAATFAYHDIVGQRIRELRESPVTGVQTIGEFMQHRLAPAMATVVAADKRLDSLSQRIGRVSDLLRTRVDVVTEQQNQQLLEQLTRGQALQLKLQQTVEGLSIAAISYYVVSLVYYLAKAAKTAGLVSITPDVVAGVAILPTVVGVWQVVRRIHRSIAKH